ncbi:hypothetical protein QJ856_gp0771 [Tupanvirus deep ocean]|uniref:Uncharacterized protein n=2 Tax=Tupanvirus TaxID=2094720 RepID=A0AC62A880_9VIRU|nr:hypothetical protein QJ856_gp0771 [Tupanvirus deep ocean]QKU33981.1 hypothetical protein [Tupanvirus deep ocean]
MSNTINNNNKSIAHNISKRNRLDSGSSYYTADSNLSNNSGITNSSYTNDSGSSISSEIVKSLEKDTSRIKSSDAIRSLQKNNQSSSSGYNSIESRNSVDSRVNSRRSNDDNVDNVDIEYLMNVLKSKIKGIKLGFLYENAEILEPNEIYDLEGKQVKNLNELYSFINIILHDVFDLIIKSKLLTASTQSIPNYKYEVFGGKAFERIMNPLFKGIGTFDFDIELAETPERLFGFSKALSNQIGSYIDYNFGPIRHFIKNILHKHNLINEECFDHYENVSNKLIHFGTRLTKGGNTRPGIFLHLVLRKDLFVNGKFNNYPDQKSEFNVIFYPLADIKITNNVDNAIEDNNVKYAPLSKSFYGYLDSLIHDTKEDKNISRLLNLKNPAAYICNPNFSFPIRESNYDDNLRTDLSIIENLDYKEYDNKIDKINNFGIGIRNYTNTKKLMEDLVMRYYSTYIRKVMPLRNNCQNYLDSLTMNPFKPMLIGPMVIMRARLINELKTVDQANGSGVYVYTGGKHNHINMYRQLVNLGLQNDPKSNTYFPNQKQLYAQYGQNMDIVFDVLYNSANYISMVDNLFNDEFEVISSQTFLYFNSPNGKISDAISLSQDKGSIVYMPNFLSTAYRTFPEFMGFLSPMKVLYKIKIKVEHGKGKNWIFIDTYSQVPRENEILIRAGSYFVIEDVDFVPISAGFGAFNVKLITMRLCNNFEEAIEHAKNFSDIHLLYGQFSPELFVGGSDKTNIFSDQKPNFIVNPYTIMIDAENLDPSYKNISTYEELINAYIKHYPLFSNIIDEYSKRIMIANTQVYGYSKSKEAIKSKYPTTVKIPPTQKATLHKLEIPGLYSETESNYVPIAIQTGAGGDDIFHKKYLKYKNKYMHLKNKLLE